MQTNMIEEEILSTVHDLPIEIQREVLKFIKNKLQEKQTSNPKIAIPTFHGDGLKKGVDLNNSRELQDLLDEDGITRR